LKNNNIEPNTRVYKLATQILATQQDEINLMKSLL